MESEGMEKLEGGMKAHRERADLEWARQVEKWRHDSWEQRINEKGTGSLFLRICRRLAAPESYRLMSG